MRQSMSKVRVTVRSPSATLALTLAVPPSPVEVACIVPALHALDDSLISDAAAAVEHAGRGITCRRGCTACCFQLVPVTEMEAPFLNRTVDSLPPNQAQAVRARAADAIRILEAADLLSELGRIGQLSQTDVESLAIRYFRVQVPCPFFDGASCSIYEHRPLACREYLVTSERERCERFGEETVDRVPLPISLFSHLTQDGRIGSEPLVLALQRSEHRAGREELLPGAVHLKRLLEGERRMAGGGSPR